MFAAQQHSTYQRCVTYLPQRRNENEQPQSALNAQSGAIIVATQQQTGQN